MSYPMKGVLAALPAAHPSRGAQSGAASSRHAGSAPLRGAGKGPEQGMAAAERERIAQRLQETMRASGRDLEFRVDEASDRVVISVRDGRTGELIRQIPDDTALRIAQRVEARVEQMRSVLLEDRA